MPHQITVTGKTGPDRTNTAIVLANVRSVLFDLAAAKMQVEINPPVLPAIPTAVNYGSNFREYDLVGKTTVTCTITAGQYAFVVS